MTRLPTGTVTFLFTDIEGSTRLLKQLGDRYADVLADHHRLLHAAFAEHGGQVVDTQGDAFFVAFARARDAVEAAVAGQRALAAHRWPDGTELRVRMGIHTGEPKSGAKNYVGLGVHRAARISSIGHGGQVLLSNATRELLADELPARVGLRDLGEHQLKDLERPERVFQLVVDGLPHQFPPLKAEARAAARLPAAANPLIGRQTEVRALRALLLGDARLVTVTGAGGSGKTRLALELATSLAAEFVGHVYFVPLAAVQRVEIVPTILSVLGVGEADDRPLRALKDFLRAQAVLLVLDNFEHLLEEAPLLAELLVDCPELTLLVTSRASLHLSGEYDYPLEPLPLEHAVALFAERARAVRPDFAGDDAVLNAICTQLDCLPLALELAAAHSRLLSAGELLGRLEHRLELLAGGPRDLAARQQTLRETIEWSYGLLDREEQQLFARLAVFDGGCTLEAAERVCGASLDRLESLADKSLIRRRETAGETRFSMLETIRAYALERLEAGHALEAVCEVYSDYYFALARQRVAELDQGQLTALHALEREFDNFLSAFAWSHTPQPVPVPVNDGSCDRLIGLPLPSLVLESTQGPLDLADLAAGRLVLYVYPGTTKPGRPPLPGLYQLVGGRGCTSENRGFRDHAAELAALGAQVAGLSVQTLDQQLEFAGRAQMPFPLFADPECRFEAALGLPTFEVAGITLYKRVTLVAERGLIGKIFYPVFPPDRNAEEVVAWLAARRRSRLKHTRQQ